MYLMELIYESLDAMEIYLDRENPSTDLKLCVIVMCMVMGVEAECVEE